MARSLTHLERCARRLGILLTAGLLTACQTDCDPSDLSLHRARNAMLMGEFVQARGFFVEDLTQHPDRRESLKQLPMTWLNDRPLVLSEAIAAFDQYLERHPEDIDMQLRRADTLIQAGEWDRLETLDPLLGTSTEAALIRSRILEQQHPELAIEPLREVLASAPDHLEALEQSARLHQQLGQPDIALELAQRAMQHASPRSTLYYLLSRSAMKSGQTELARRALMIHDLLRTISPQNNQAVDPQTASEAQQSLQQLAPRVHAQPALVIERIRVLLRQGHRTAAIDAYDHSSAIVPWQPAEIMALANLARQHRHWTLASRLYGSLRDLEAFADAAELGLAAIALAQQDYSALAAGAENLSTRLCWMATPWYYHAQAALHQGDPDAAERALTKAVLKAPWRDDWRILLARMHLSAGRATEAKQVLDSAPVESDAILRFRQDNGIRS